MSVSELYIFRIMKPSALQAILQNDRHESISRVLAAVAKEVGADDVAIFNIATGKPEMFAPETLPAPHRKRVDKAWPRACSLLLSGEVYAEAQFTLLPIGHPPVALLYFAGVGIEPAAARAVTVDYGDFFEAAILSSDQNRLAYLERTPVEDIERDKTMLLLQRNGWNYRLVADLLAISRQALHKRLKKYGVCRPLRFTRQKSVQPAE